MDAANSTTGTLVEALNARVYGNGAQTLVLAHGYGLDQTTWRHVLPYLVCYFKVVVFDQPFSTKAVPDFYDPKKYSNYYSYAQDLEKLLDELHLNNTIFLGHSMSAMIGCIAATQRPDLFKHLLLLNGSPRFLNDEGYNGGFEKEVIEALLKAIEIDCYSWATNFAPHAAGVNNTDAAHEFESSFGRIKPSIALDVAKTIFRSDYRFVLEQVKVPCTVIQSEKDIEVPLSVPSYMKKMLGGSTRVEIMKTEGHFPQLSAYTLLVDVIKKVLCVEQVRGDWIFFLDKSMSNLLNSCLDQAGLMLIQCALS